MNKKQRNRKLVSQNKRNRMINRRYTSTIKTLLKLFLLKIKVGAIETNNDEKTKIKTESIKLSQNLSSIIDKAVKKGVIHKNTAARKKSRISKLFTKI